jgi:hypothetical protein
MYLGLQGQERTAVHDVPQREDVRLCDRRGTCKLHAVRVMPHVAAVPALALFNPVHHCDTCRVSTRCEIRSGDAIDGPDHYELTFFTSVVRVGHTVR